MPVRTRALGLLAASALVAAALAACGGSHERYVSHVQRGQRYLAEDNLAKASIELRNALQIEPKNAEALYLEGTVEERRGNLREAIALYQSAVDLVPTYEVSRAALARVYVLGGASQRALEIIGPGLIEHPDSPDLLAARAVAGHQLRDDVDALKDAERAVQLAPANENAVAVLAGLYSKRGEHERALAIVNDALSKVPASIDLRHVLCDLYLAAGEPGKAAQQMQKIIELKPHVLAFRLQLAMHYTRLQKLNEAQRVLLDAVRDMPENDGAKLELVNFLVARRSRAQGEHVLRDFLAREPANDYLRLGLAALLQRAGATTEAIAIYREVVRREGTAARGLAARDRIAAIEVSLHHEQEAQHLVAEVLNKNPVDADALILRANIALAHSDPAAAVVDLRAALRDQPRSVPLYRMLARAYLAKGDHALAEEALRSAIEVAPDDPAIKLELTQILIQTDRAAQAVTLLEGTRERFPQDLKVREALVRAYMARHDLPRARAAAEELQQLAPDSPVGFNFAGQIAQQDKRMEDAERSFERALEVKPGAPDVLASLARLALARGNPRPAIGRLQAAIDKDPRNVQLIALLGELYLASKDYPHATDTLNRALATDPRWWIAYHDLAQLRLAVSDPAGAISEYERGLKAIPGQLQLVMELATLYEKQGRIDEAIGRYEALARSGPLVQQLAANNIAMLLVTYRSDPTSLDRARDLSASFITSDNGSLLDTNGWVRYKRREYPDALAVLERARERVPDSRVIRYHLGMTELKLGQRERARSDLESALSGEAAFPGVEEARATLASLGARPAAAPRDKSESHPSPLAARQAR
jgi:tetratricopeptide (TPR) repeat protein